MGCAESSVEAPRRNPARFFEGGFKQNPFVVEIPKPQVNVSTSSIDDGNRQVLYGIIQRDSEKELAFCLDEWEIAVDSEIQNPGTYWTLMHLCARWNAVKCLSFVLRKYYQEHSSNYVKFVNTQTIEGYTPLMLTVIWGSQESFELLLNCGGSDLSLRDARGADIFHHAFSYRREKMQPVLNGFRQNNQMMLNVNTNALQTSVDLNAMLVSTEDSSQDVQTGTAYRNSALQQQQLQNFRMRQEETLRKNQEELALLAQAHRKDQERIALEKKRIADEQHKLKEAAIRQLQEAMNRVKQEWLRSQQEQFQQFQQQQLMQQQQLQQQMQQQQLQQQQRAEQERKMKEQQQRDRQAYQQQMMIQQMQQQAALQEKRQMQEEAMRQKAAEQRLLEEQRKAQEAQAQRRQAEFIEKQRQIQKQKEDQLKKIVEEQKRAEQQRILNEQRANEQKKLEEQRQLQAKFQEDDMQRRIAEQREMLKKSLEEQRRKLEQNTGPTQTAIDVTNLASNPASSGLVCPADVKPLYDQLLARKVNFIDDKFPPKLSTIGDNSKVDNDMRSSIWLRPAQIFNRNYQLFDGIDPDDVKQGSLGVCYYLSTLSALAEKEGRIRPLFPFYNKELGFYVVKLYIHGKPTNIVVDDFMPCLRGTNEPMFTKPNGDEIWVMVLEKAWVKNFGSYLSAEAMSPDTMMENIDGAPAKGVWIEDSAKQFNNLLNYDNQNYIMVLTSLSDNVPKGIVAGHAYSLLQVYNIKGVKLYKIRNPWGSFEWDGTYSSTSRKWTPELKKAVNYVEADDGIFFMTPEELILGFNYYSVGMIRENYTYSCLEFNSEPLEDVYFTFTVKKKCDLNLRLVQRFDRFLNDPSYVYSPLIFEVGRINSPESATFMGQGSDNSVFGDKSIHHHEDVYQSFDAGTYFVRVRMLWKQKIRTAVLVGYAAEPLTFSRMNGDEGLKHWKNMLRNVLSKEQKEPVIPGINYVQTWMKGQYIFYAENTTNRDYEFTVKFEPNEFQNCRMGLKKVTDADMKFQMRAKNGSNIGTIEKIELEKECQIGSIGFQARAL